MIKTSDRITGLTGCFYGTQIYADEHRQRDTQQSVNYFYVLMNDAGKTIELVDPNTGRKKWKKVEITVRLIKFCIPGFLLFV